jgi:hypothetical protein
VDIERIIGSRGIRGVTLVAAVILVTTMVLRAYGIAPWTGGRAFLVFSVGVGFIAFIALIHSFRTLYDRWLAVAAFLQRVVITLLFGGCYLLVVPWFALLARVIGVRGLRGRPGPRSFWVRRRHSPCDESYFTRMG